MENRPLDYADFEDEGKELSEYIDIAKRRKMPMLITAGIIATVTLLALLIWPPTYRSTATILIEEQEIPRDLVRSTITSFAAQQVQVISQRIMTLANISKLVDKFGLYPDEIASQAPRTEIAQVFREAVAVDLVSADVIDPRSGRPAEATIAFTLGFDYQNPELSQKVASELVTLYLNENLRSRNEKSANTAEFLTAEAQALQQELDRLEGELATFKEENEGSLPELYDFNINTVSRTERELLEIDLRVQELEKRKIQLSSELAQISPTAPVALASGQMVLGDADRLKALETEYRRESARYKANHPTVVRLKREIEEVRAKLGIETPRSELLKSLDNARSELKQLQGKFAADSPQVNAQKRVIAQLENELLQSERNTSVAAPDNPAYLLIQTQLDAADTEIASLKQKSASLRKKISEHEAMIRKAPGVEKAYKAILRDYDNASLKYREIKAKQLEASLAQNLERDRKGERFTLIEPPAYPLEPISPNKPALLLVGLLLAGFGAVAIAALMEMTDQSIRGEKALADELGIAPFAVIPYIANDAEQASQNKLRNIIIASAIAGALILLALIHIFYKPLDVLWFVLLNRVGG
jgi:uncharacterized protein involved in exopolysaccharide biosynthesis